MKGTGKCSEGGHYLWGTAGRYALWLYSREEATDLRLSRSVIFTRYLFMNLYAQIFQELEEGLYLPLPEDDLLWVEEKSEESLEDHVLA